MSGRKTGIHTLGDLHSSSPIAGVLEEFLERSKDPEWRAFFKEESQQERDLNVKMLNAMKRASDRMSRISQPPKQKKEEKKKRKHEDTPESLYLQELEIAACKMAICDMKVAIEKLTREDMTRMHAGDDESTTRRVISNLWEIYETSGHVRNLSLFHLVLAIKTFGKMNNITNLGSQDKSEILKSIIGEVLPGKSFPYTKVQLLIPIVNLCLDYPRILFCNSPLEEMIKRITATQLREFIERSVASKAEWSDVKFSADAVSIIPAYKVGRETPLGVPKTFVEKFQEMSIEDKPVEAAAAAAITISDDEMPEAK